MSSLLKAVSMVANLLQCSREKLGIVGSVARVLVICNALLAGQPSSDAERECDVVLYFVVPGQ